MRRILSAHSMAESDLLTLKKEQISSFDLMNRVASDMVAALLARNLSKKFLILTGPGNNGGDGYCVAEKLRALQFEVKILSVYEPQSQDCKTSKKKSKAEILKELPENLEKDFVILDAIFGTGARKKIDKPLEEILKKLNKYKNFKVALDCPTPGFKADLTLCVGFYKESFLDENYSEYLGEVELISAYFQEPKNLSKRQTFVLQKNDFSFSNIKRSSHKGYYGRAGLVVGSAATPGAAFLAGEAAARVGAGYITIFFADTTSLKISVKDASFVLKQKWKVSDLKNLSSLVLGCGGYSKKIKNISIPHIVDAEALIPLSRIKSKLPRIFTPHPGEAAKILKQSVGEVLSNRFEALEKMVKLTRSAVYLKGASGILQFYDEPNISYVNLSANPAFSRAGSGDILAGIMGGFLAQAENMNIDFKSVIFSSLVFQRELGEVLRRKRGLMVSDQLSVFSEAFERLK